MYADDTEFLTGKGWKNIHELQKYDDIATCDDALNFKWVPVVQAGFDITPLKQPILQCLVGKTGRFAVTEDHAIRFFKPDRKNENQIVLSHSLKQVMDKLQSATYLPAYIPTNFNEMPTTPSTGQNAQLLARMLPFIYKISPKGDVHFYLNVKMNKTQLTNFLLQDLNIHGDYVRYNPDNNQMVVRGTLLADWYKAVLYNPRLIIETIDRELLLNDPRTTVQRRLRFYCPRVAALAQIAILFSDRSSLYNFIEITSGKSHRLTIDPGNRSVTFRNKIILLPDTAQAVKLDIPHPITRWKGSVVSL